MNSIVEVVKDFFIPGSITFLISGLIIGTLLLYRRGAAATWGRRCLTLLAALYFTLSTPLCSNALEAILSHGYTDQADVADMEGIAGIVILGGGSLTLQVDGQEMDVLSDASIMRVLEGGRLYHALDNPLVIVSGGTNERAGVINPESMPMRAILVDIGVPAERILLESSSQNTFEQALKLRPLLEAHGLEHFILVTSPTHMRRAVASFRAQGLDPTSSASAQHSDGFLSDRCALLPKNDALEASRQAFREGMAFVYYALRGWLSMP